MRPSLALILLATALASCSKPGHSLIGTWSDDDLERKNPGALVRITYSPDGTFETRLSTGGAHSSLSGTWTLNGDQLTISVLKVVHKDGRVVFAKNPQPGAPAKITWTSPDQFIRVDPPPNAGSSTNTRQKATPG